MNSNLYELTAKEVSGYMELGSISAKDVVSSCVLRTKQLNNSLLAIVAWDEKYVQLQAKTVDATEKKGLLLGVPVGIKDVMNTLYYPTEKGSVICKGYKAGNDARCVSYLRNNNAIVFAKTATAELAVHADQKTRNPYCLERTAGSSSGGSAAAVATGMVPVATGTQTGGSIIRPASWCGVYGMKPSYGLIPRTGILKTTDTLDSVGFFSRSIADLEIMLRAMSISGKNFPVQLSGLQHYAELPKENWHVACCDTLLEKMQPDFIDRFARFFSDLKSVKKITTKKCILPKETKEFRELHRRIYHPCLKYYLKNEIEKNPALVSDILKEIFLDAKTLPITDYAKALKEQSSLTQKVESFFAETNTDFILLISSNGGAPVVEPKIHLDVNALWTMTGLPVINVPVFKDTTGLPFGLQIVGPKFSDYRMLSFAKYLASNAVIPDKIEVIEPKVRQFFSETQLSVEL